MTEIEQQANKWLVILHSGAASHTDIDEFKQWLKVSPLHAQAFREAETLWRMTRYSTSLLSSDQLAPSCHKTTKYKAFAAAAVVLMALLVVFLQFMPVHQQQNEWLLTTSIGQVKTFVLADNSSVTLGADSKVSVWFDNEQRNTRIIKGDALFDIARNPQRPFVTHIDDARITVLGTQFDVQKRPQQTSITVGHGEVAVSKQNRNVNLTPGQKVVLSKNKMSKVVSVDPHFFAQWKQQRFTFSRNTLEDVVSVINRYSSTPVRIVTPSLKTLEVTVAFSGEQSMQLLESLAYQYGFEVSTYTAEIVIF
ncbi:FecR domain-containing protein [Aestuariibacter sp. A3R04]|uniref:FecR family protein n=1 Tax=Aestuariibacter sp. A3R04 TaxID=2841571 RepID=UPI002091CEAD|nr:FecR domain-containing protein [Aestuariibacter sp. A3R04]